MVASESVRYLVCISGLEKLGCLWHESPCSSKRVQENVVRLKILCTCDFRRYTCSPHPILCRAPNKIWKDEAIQQNFAISSRKG